MSNLDFIVKHGLQVRSNVVVGEYATNVTPITNGLIVSGQVGIGTSTVSEGAFLEVQNGNIILNTLGFGIVYPDGSYQNTAVMPTPAAGQLGAIQYSDGFNGFAGDIGKFILDPFSGFVGINNSFPQAYLDVAGDALITGNSSVNSGNLRIESNGYGIVFPDGSFQTTAVSNAPAAGITGSVQYKDATGAFAGDGNNFYYDFTLHRLGIGTSNITNTTLNIAGNAPSLFNTENGSDLAIVVGNALSTGSTLGYNPTSNYGYLRTSLSGTNILTFNSAGLGIKGVTPVNALDVSGAAVIGGGLAYAGAATAPTNGLLVQGSVGVGTVTPSSKLSVYGGNLQVGSIGYGVVFPDGTLQTTAATNTPPGGTNRAIQFNDNGVFGGDVTKFSFDTNGNVGIGTSAPTARLHVAGTATVTATTVSTSTTTGALIVSGGIGVTGNAYVGNVNVGNHIDFAKIPYTNAPDYQEGRLWYSSDEDTLILYGNSANIQIPIGEREWVRCRNSSGAMIPKGTPVYEYGVHMPGHPVHGHHPLIAPADASDVTKRNVIGVTGEDIQNGSHGYVIVRGYIETMNTSALTSGQRAYLGAETPGTLVATSPDYPNYPVSLGFCLTSNATVGTFYVSMLDESFDKIRVIGSGYTDGNFTIGGNLTVNGTSTSLVVNTVSVGGPYVTLLSGDSVTNTFSGSGTNDLTFKGKYTGTTNRIYYVKIDSVGTTDTFAWSYDNFATTQASGIAITGGQQLLSYGVSVEFVTTTGHTLNDAWQGSATISTSDFGMIGNYVDNQFEYAGLIRDSSDGNFKFFRSYTGSITANINTSDSSFALGNIVVEKSISNTISVIGLTDSVSSATGALTVTGGVGINGALNVGTQIYSSGIVNAGGTAIVNALVSNGAIAGTTISGTTGTFTSLQSSGTATVNSLVSNGAITGTTISGTAATVTSLQSSGIATVSSLVSNGAISGTTTSVTTLSATTTTVTNLQNSGTTTTASLVSNGTISGTTGTFTGLQSSGTATVNSLSSNGAITGTTISGTSATVTSLQSSGTATVNAVVSNVYGVFGQNVTINSSNASTSTTTGALVLKGGLGLAGAINAGDQIYSSGVINAGGTAIVNSLISNSAISGVTGTFTSVQSSGSITGQSITSNTTITATTGLTVLGGGAAITGASSVTGNLTITGNLFVTGSFNRINSNVLVVDDPLIYLANTNPADTYDLGLVAAYNNGIHIHTGFARNHNDGVWTVYDGLSNEPYNNQLNWSAVNYGSFKAGNINVAASTASISTTTGALITAGGIGIAGAVNVGGQIFTAGVLNAGGAAIVNSLTSNGAISGTTISGTTGTFTGLQSSGTATVSSLVSNGSISGTTITGTATTITSLQASSTATVNSLVSNGTISGTTGTFTGLQSSGTATVSSLVSNGAISGTTISGTATTVTSLQSSGTATVNSLVSNGTISGTTGTFTGLQSSGTATVSSLVSNGAISGTTISGTAATVTSLQSSGTATVSSLVSNGAISGTTGTFTGLQSSGTATVSSLVSNGTISGTATTVTSLQSSGTATVNSLVSNGAISGTTISGTATTITSLQASGTATVNALVSNGAISGTTITGTATTITSLQASGTATVNALVSNGAISGTTGTFTSLQNSGTATVNALVSNVYGLFGQNLTVNSSNASTSTTTGAIVTAGGVGVAGNINVGGTLNTFTGNVGIGTTTVTTGYKFQVNGQDTILNGLVVGRGGNNTGIRIGSTATMTNGSPGTTNYAIGDNVFGAGAGGTYNIGIGYNAFYGGGSGDYNIGIGHDAFYGSYGSYNVGVGISAVRGQHGTWNTGVGNYTLGGGTGGGTFYGNSSFGYRSLFKLAGGNYNTTFGHLSGNVVTTGSNNTLIGPFAGANITIGSNNTVLGAYDGLAGPISQTGNNYVVLSDGVGNVRFYSDPNGNVGIGTTSATVSARLGIYGGNLKIGTTGYGVVFPDGTFQTTASANTPPGGATGAVQYNNGGVFGGDAVNFYYDSVNYRLGIGTSATSVATLNVVGNLPSLFNTQNGSDPQVIVGNSTSFGSTLGYNIASNYGYLRNTPSGTNMLTWNTSGVGIKGITPINALDVSGGAVIGGGLSYAGTATAPSNGLLVQGTVGIGLTNPTSPLTVAGQANIYIATASTSTTTGAIITTGGVGIALGINAGGQIFTSGIMNSGSTGIHQSIISNTTIQSSGTATVNALVSNGTISGTSTTVTGFQASGTATVASLNSNGAISGTTISGTQVNGTAFQGAGTATVNALVSNVYGYFGQNLTVNSSNASTSTTTGAIVTLGGIGAGGGINAGGQIYTSGAINSGSTGIYQSIISNTTVQAAGTATVNTLVSNVSGVFGQNITVNSSNASTSTTTGAIVTAGGIGVGGAINAGGQIYSAGVINAGGTAIVNALTSNGAIIGTTMTGTAATVTSLQNSGTTITNALVGNVYGVFGQNLTVNSSNASTSTTTGAIVTAGGIGVAGAINTGGQIYTSGIMNSGSTGIHQSIISNTTVQAAGTATVNALISNGTITGTTATLTGLQSSGTATVSSLVSNGAISGTTISGTAATVTSLQSSGTATVNALVSNGAISGTTISGTAATVTSLQSSGTATVNALVSNGTITGTTATLTGLQSSGTATVNALVSNGTITGTTATLTGLQSSGTATVSSLVSNGAISGTTISGTAATVTSLQSSGTATVNALVSNGAISGTTISGTAATVTSLQSSGTATVSSLVSNGAISGTTISGTAATVTSLQSSGTATVNSLVSNVYGYFGQNVTVKSSNASISTITGALVVGGGVGVSGNVYVANGVHLADNNGGTSSAFYMQYNSSAGAVDFIFG